MDKASAVDLTMDSASIVDIVKDKTSSANLAKGGTPAVDLAKNKASSNDLPKDGASAVDLAKNRTSAVDLAKGGGSAVDLAKYKASADDLAKGRALNVDTVMALSSDVDMPLDRSSAVDLAMYRSSAVDLSKDRSPDQSITTNLTHARTSAVDLENAPSPSIADAMIRSSAAGLKAGDNKAPIIVIHSPSLPSNSVDSCFDSLPDNEICNITGYTGAEKKMLWTSWKEMTGGQENRAIFSRRLISWMYEYIPIMPKRFIDGWVKELGNSGAAKKFLQHAYSLIRELDIIVALLPSAIDMMDRINGLMEYHVNRRPMVGTKYFKPFYQHFGTFVSGHLSQPTNSQVVMLWVSLIGIFYRVMADHEAFVTNEPVVAVMSVSDVISTVAQESETEEKEKVKVKVVDKKEKQSSCGCCRLM